MIRVLSDRNNLLKLGPRLMIGSFAGFVVAWFSDLGILGALIVIISLPLFVVGAMMAIWGWFSPDWLMQFDKNGMRYHKAPNTLIPWSDIRKFSYSVTLKSTDLWLEIENSPFTKNKFRLYFHPSVVDPHFQEFDDFIVELEKLYGATIIDESAKHTISKSQLRLLLWFVYFPLILVFGYMIVLNILR